MIKPLFNPVSVNCNIRCGYCFHRNKNQADPVTLMTIDIAEKFIQQYIEAYPNAEEYEFIWHGGEPTMAGLSFFNTVVEIQNRFTPNGKQFVNGIQTNGILINQEWAEFFKKNKFKVGVSIDGPQLLHDAYRVSAKGKGTYEKAVAAICLLQKNGIEVGCSAVIHSGNVNYPELIFGTLLSLGIKTFRLGPCIEVGRSGFESYSLKPLQFSKFVTRMFDLWWELDDPSIEIGFIADVIDGFKTGYSPCCVLSDDCKQFLVFDWDGSVKSCENLLGENQALGNIWNDSLKNILAKPQGRYFQLYDKIDGLRAASCSSCEWFEMCRGGCPYQWDLTKWKTYLCEDHKIIFRHIGERLEKYLDIANEK